MSSRHTFHVQVNKLTRPEEKDLVIIGGGVAGYVAAIKAGQAGLKVSLSHVTSKASIDKPGHLY